MYSKTAWVVYKYKDPMRNKLIDFVFKALLPFVAASLSHPNYLNIRTNTKKEMTGLIS